MGPTTGLRRAPAAADLVFGLLVVGTAAYFVRETRGFGFRADDWAMASRGGSFGDYFEPYNDALAPIPIAVYRSLYELFGFGTALPLRLFGVGALVAISVAMYLVYRARVGPVLALVAATLLLWHPSSFLNHANFNHYLALVFTIACAWVLPRSGRSADVGLALLILLAVGNSGAGVSAAVGCIVYCALTRAHVRRWIAVLAPAAAWAVWWLLVSEGGRNRAGLRTIGEPVLTGLHESFTGLAFGNETLGIVLALAFAVLLGARLRRGVRACANECAWTIALVAWWAGLAIARPGGNEGQFRYQIVGSALVLLACLPTRRIEVPARVDARIAIVFALVAGALVVGLNQPDIERSNAELRREHARIRQGLIVANRGPDDMVEWNLVYVGGIARLPARQYWELVRRWGVPDGTSPRDPDRTLLGLSGAHLALTDDPATVRCQPLDPTLLVPPTAAVVLRSGSEAVDVSVERYDSEPTEVGRLPANSAARLSLPGLGGNTGWTIDGPGVCVDYGATIQNPVPSARVRNTIAVVALMNIPDALGTVEFHLAGRDLDHASLGTARATVLGLVHEWDSTSVPNGSYELTAVATDTDGSRAVSPSVPVVVVN